MTNEEILKELKCFAYDNGLTLTKYAERIAEAKRRLCKEWFDCPCHRDGLHYCGSETCKKEIEENGFCGCNLYEKKKDNSTVGFLLSKIHEKRIKELEQDVDILVNLIKEKLPEYTDWIETNFGGQDDGKIK